MKSSSISFHKRALFGACTAFALCPAVSSADVTNDRTSASYTTIQEAIDAADPGDELVVDAGTYLEDLEIDKSISLVTAGDRDDTTIEGVISGEAGNIQIRADDVTIDGFTIAGNKKPVRLLEATSGFQFLNNRLETGDNSTAPENGWVGIESDYNLLHEGMVLDANIFDANTTAQLIYINNAPDITVTNNTIEGEMFPGGLTLGLGSFDGSQIIQGNTFDIVSTYALLEVESGSYDILQILDENSWTQGGVAVDSGNQVHNTIQAAVDAAAAGDSIRVAAGSYSESITVSEEITLNGPNAGTPGTDSGRAAEAVIDGDLEIVSDGVTIDGLMFDASDETFAILAKVSNANSYSASNLTIVNNVFDGVNDSGGSGSASAVYFLGDNGSSSPVSASNIQISDNLIQNVGGSSVTVSVKGIYFGDSTGNSLISGVTITGNTIENVSIPGAGAYGILLNQGVNAGGSMDDVTISGNTITELEGSWTHAIGLETETTNTQVSGNEISNLVDNNSDFPNADATAVFFEGNTAGGSVIVENNIFGDDIEGYGVAIHPNDAGDYTVDASANYWNAADGPSGEGSGSGVAVGPGVTFAPWFTDEALTTQDGPVRIVGGDAYGSIQAAIDAAAASDVIEVDAGIFSAGTINIDKDVTIEGANSGTPGHDSGRAAESRLEDTKLTISASGAVVDGFEIYQTNDTADAVLLSAGGTLTNSVIRREGANPGSLVRGVTTAVGTSGFTVSDNLFTGDPSGGFFSGHLTWNSGMYVNGGTGDITDNVFENCRTAINLDDFNAGISVEGNSFASSGSYLSFGGVSPADGQFAIANNDLGIDFNDPQSLPSAMFNLSNVESTFEIDATGNTFGGIATGSLTDSQKIAVEARIFHRGWSGRNGTVQFVAGEHVVAGTTTIASAIDVAQAGESVLVGPATYSESPTITKELSLRGPNAGLAGTDSGRVDEAVLDGGFRVTASNVVIDGFTINGLHSGANPAGVFAAASDVTVTNSIVEGITGGDGGIVTEGGVNNLTATDNLITANNRGLYLNPGDGHMISGNEISANTSVGIGSDGQSNLTVTDNVFTNNVLEGIGASSVGANVSVTGNNFTGNTDAVAHYGGDPIDATLNYWGGAGVIADSGPYSPNNVIGGSEPGSVTFSPWYADANRSVQVTTSPDNEIGDGEDVDEGNLFVPAGETLEVTSGGSLTVESLNLGDGATLSVQEGSLTLGDGTTISGTFTIFNSFGSWNINGDTTFDTSQTLALVTDIHVASGATLTVNGGGDFILDGCVIDSQTSGSTYNINVENDGLLTIARSVVSDAVIDVNTLASSVDDDLQSKIYDSRFESSDIEATDDSAVYHNIFDAATDSASNTDGTTAFDGVDGWANVTDANNIENPFTLDFVEPTATARTLDGDGNLFVQTNDSIEMELNIGALSGGRTVVGAEALIGYNSNLVSVSDAASAVDPNTANGNGNTWDVTNESGSVSSGLGLSDTALSLELEALDDGTSGDENIGEVTFTALAPGRTVGFFRVQTDRVYSEDGELVKDTRLIESELGEESFLTAFTRNAGELVIDDQDAVVVGTPTGEQEQASNGTVSVFTSPNYAFRSESEPVVVSFDGQDNGLSGLDAADADDDVVVEASIAGTTLTGSLVSATDNGGSVSYVYEIDVDSAPNGTYAVTATLTDRSGNVSSAQSLGSFEIANEVFATVELQGFSGSTRDIDFVTTDGSGAVLDTYADIPVTFSGNTGSVNLPAVNGATNALSAKTDWHLRSKVSVSLVSPGIGSCDLIGGDRLLGGDLNGDNVVNTLDYARLRYRWQLETTGANPVLAAEADITGDGIVNIDDYNPLQNNFYTLGDDQ